MSYWQNSLRGRRLRKVQIKEEEMKPTVLICCSCKRINRFGEFVTLTRERQFELDVMEKRIKYVYCPMCEANRNSNRLLLVDERS